MADYSKIVISSDDRDLSAVFVADPDDISGESGELYLQLKNPEGDTYYKIPEDYLDKPQQWRDVISPYPSQEDYFTNAFVQKEEIWNVCHFLEDERRSHQVVRYKIRYTGESGSEKKLFELFYKIYKTAVYTFEYPSGEKHVDNSGEINVKAFEDGTDVNGDVVLNGQHVLEQGLELEPVFE